MSSSASPSTSRYQPYNIINRYSYREGKIPIRTIIITKLDKYISNKELLCHFQKFGEITYLSITTTLRRQNNYALITFQSPEEAEMILRIKHRILPLRRKTYIPLKVEPAASEHQPPPLPEPIKFNNTQSLLLSLNDACILHVFSLLELYDQVKLAGLCTRLKRLGETFLKKKIKRFNFNAGDFNTIYEASYVLENIGENVEHCIIRSGASSSDEFLQLCVEFLPPLCPNLKILELAKVTITNYIYKQLLPTFRELKSLTLKKCKLQDNIFLYLKNCVKIEKLDLSENPLITGEHFTANAITELSLSECIQIRSEYFLHLCTKANFTKINIDKCKEVYSVASQLSQIESLASIHMCNNYYSREDYFPHNEFFEELAKTKSDTLKSFCFSYHKLNDFQKNALKKFSCLKHLCLSYLDDDFLNELNNSLNYLGVSNSPHLSEDAIVNFVDKSPNIQTINISSCTHFVGSLVLKLIEQLKILRRPNCLKLIVSYYVFFPSVEREFKHLLELEECDNFFDPCCMYKYD